MDSQSLDQLNLFVISILCGLVVGFIFDVFRVLRRHSKKVAWAVSLQDISFWLVVLVVTLWLLFYLNDGEVRWYYFLGISLGVAAYIHALSGFFTNILLAIVAVIQKIFITLIKIILFPIVIMWRLLRQPILFVSLTVKKTSRKTTDVFKAVGYKASKNISVFKKILTKH